MMSQRPGYNQPSEMGVRDALLEEVINERSCTRQTTWMIDIPFLPRPPLRRSNLKQCKQRSPAVTSYASQRQFDQINLAIHLGKMCGAGDVFRIGLHTSIQRPQADRQFAVRVGRDMLCQKGEMKMNNAHEAF